MFGQEEKMLACATSVYKFLFDTHFETGTFTSVAALCTFWITVVLSSPLSLSDVNVSSTGEKFIDLILIFLL